MAKKNQLFREISFPIVGIGGSAGGYQAVSQLIEHLSSNTGMAFIYLQHGNPEKESRLVALLSKNSKIPVLEAENEMTLEPDFFYVVPPGSEVLLEEGSFKIIERQKDHFDHHPINRFFTSLATNYKEFAIGVILSGGDNDGSEGLRAIKAAGGMTFAQDETAIIGSMPRSAVAENVVDLILSPKEMAEEIKSLGNQKQAYYEALRDLGGEIISSSDENLLNILRMLQTGTGVNFHDYKMNTIKRRIIRRMVIHKLDNLEEYVGVLREKPSELNLLFNDLLINVTSFFRDPDLTNYLKDQLLPLIIKSKKPGEPVRIWVPACSTGQEVYSLAILLVEIIGDQYVHLPIQIFATDLSESAITKARLGLYSKAELQGVEPDRLQKFFTRVDGNYRIIKGIRDFCIFATHNITKDPPFSKVDLISCCNLMIYLENNLQKKVLSTFHHVLNNPGYLVLGKSETVGSAPNLFTQLDKKIKLYVKKKDNYNKAPLDISYYLPHDTRHAAAEKQNQIVKNRSEEIDLQKAVDHLLLKLFTPAAVVIDQDMDIVQFRGATGIFLDPTPGKASLNLLKMAQPGLGFELRNAVHKAIKTGQPVKRASVEISKNDRVHLVNIDVLPIQVELQKPYYLVTFQETTPPPETEIGSIKDRRVKQLESELVSLREDMRSMVESQEATVEELQSANEEIVSSNEELQSINEELETSKEELESSNEELIIINQELQQRNEQLTESQQYAEGVFSTMRESLVVLDKHYKVKMANQGFYKNFELLEEHTENRLFYDLNNRRWNHPRIKELLEEKLREINFVQGFEITLNFEGIGDKTLVLNARKISRKIYGEQLILLAIQDITEHRRAQQIITDREKWFRNLADNAPVMIWVTDKEKMPLFFNKAWLEFRGDTQEEAMRKGWTDGMHPDDLPRILKLFNSRFSEKLPFETKYRVLHEHSEYVWLHNKAKPNFSPEGQFLGYIGSCVVIHEVMDDKKQSAK